MRGPFLLGEELNGFAVRANGASHNPGMNYTVVVFPEVSLTKPVQGVVDGLLMIVSFHYVALRD